MHRSNDNWERLVATVLRREHLWELFHADSRSPSVVSEASDFSPGFRSSSPLDDVTKKQPDQSAVAKLRNRGGLVFVGGVWPDFDLEDSLMHGSALVLENGTFGTVYTTKLDNGTSVIVKRLKRFGITEQVFNRNMEAIMKVKHPNVDALRDYFTRNDERLMMYDHHSSGSVSELLHGKTGLHQARVDWETRLQIAIGAARGINHIHAQNGGKMVHGNIKASNIFLNSQRYGYISEFGLANMIRTTFMPTARCYAPEVKSTQNVSQASDVYSFGILLLELITRKSPVQSSHGHEAADLVKLVNSVNHKEWDIKVLDRDLLLNPTIREEIVSMLKIGLICVAKSPKKRPKMSAVVKMMEDIRVASIGNQNSVNRVLTETKSYKLVFFGYANHTFDLDDIFRAEGEVNGKGTFGTSYKAILESGIIYSLKRLRDVIATSKKFQQHMEDIGRMGHQNVVELRAYYYSEDEKLLVYDHYDQGSVSTLLHGDKGSSKIYLDWKARLKIAVGAAKGIAHIHTRNRGKLVHGNIRSSNIFLNEQEYGVISDVGLANLTSPIRSSLIWHDGDFAPEVIDTSKVYQGSDVYSFGVVLLELLTGISPWRTVNNDQGIPLVRWVRNVIREEWTTDVFDVELSIDQNDEFEMVQVLQTAMACVSSDPEKRPTMADVVKMLEEINESETGS